MIYYLRANKTKMVKLLRLYGYSPIVTAARFEKMFRRRTYTLIWKEPTGLFNARLYSAGGVSHLRIDHEGEIKILQIPIITLKQLDMAESVPNPLVKQS